MKRVVILSVLLAAGSIAVAVKAAQTPPAPPQPVLSSSGWGATNTCVMAGRV